MPKRKDRIILDANWWISLIIMRFRNKAALIITNQNLEFISCNELEMEIKKILGEKRIQKYLDEKLKKEFWYSYFEIIKYYKIKSTVVLSRDKKDNYLLALAKDAGANFLITGDKDLLVLK